MKNLYEQNWKDVITGAKMEPSEALWDNIASSLDEEKGRNYWVTLLMIAATVTIAFSFPLTIGISDLGSHSNTPSVATQSSSDNNDDIAKTENFNSSNIIAKTKSSSKSNTQNIDYRSTQSYLKSSINNTTKTSTTFYVKKPISEVLPKAQIQGIGFESLTWNVNYQLGNLSGIYIIPYFMPIKKDENRGLIASLNMGAGSNSSGSGLLNSSPVESDLFMVLSNQDTNNPIVKEESNGTTFYLGTGVEIALGNRWSILTGIGYLNQKSDGKNNVVLDGENGYTPVGIDHPIELGSVFLSESYHYTKTNNYISIPISIKYPFINRKVMVRAGTGVSSDFMLSHIVNSETYGKVSYKPSEVQYNTIVLSAMLNLDVSYNLNNRYSISFETGIRKGITPIDKRKNIYPSSFTVGLVLFYKFR